MRHVTGDAAFVGDILFMPDDGNALYGFPAGAAGPLNRSIHKIFALTDATTIFLSRLQGARAR